MLSPKQKRSAELLAYGYSQADAAKRSGCSVRSIGRWLASDPEYA